MRAKMPRVPLRRELVASGRMNCSLRSLRCILLRSASDRLRSLETKDPDQRLACVIEIIELGALRYVFTEQMVAYRRVS